MAVSTSEGPANTESSPTSPLPPEQSGGSGPSVGGRERILSVAAERFLAAGYVETSLRDIAADSGMKAGSLYYHFESKDRLLIAVLERGMEFMVEAFEAARSATGPAGGAAGWGAPDLQPVSILAAHVEAHLLALHHNRRFTAGHVTLFRTAPVVVRDAVVPLRDAYEARWSRLLARLLPDRPPEEITMLRLALFGAMNASIDWLDTERGSVGQFAKLVTEQFWFGASGSRLEQTGEIQ